MRRILALLLTAALLTGSALALTDEEREAEIYQAGMAALAECLDDTMTDVEKLTALHDWLALHCDYGATLRSDTAYGALVEQTANCVGYAKGFAYLAALAGLNGETTYSEELDHAWILATLDGTRYFSDCTWDDGKKHRMGFIRHSYWLFDETNAADTGHYGWDSGESVPGGALEEAPWRRAVTQVVFREEYAYYIDEDFTLWRCDRQTWTEEPLATLGERWPDVDADDGVRAVTYTSLIPLNDRLYYNTPYAICSVDLEGGSQRTLLTPDTSERLIYGIAERDGVLCYSLAASEGAIEYEVVPTRLRIVR